jgi:hypothetical protein
MEKRPMFTIGKVIALIALMLLFGIWALVSSKVVRFSFGNNRECRWELNQWYNGRCVLSYYENGVRKGFVRTAKGPFTWPTAVFPGPDDQTVICIYELDTTIAVFTIELTGQSIADIPPPQSLGNTVLFSNFRVRACSKSEVAYLKNFISTNPGPLWKYAFALFASRIGADHLKEGLLNALAMGTVPHEERNGDFRYDAHPQIPPSE